MRSRLVAPGAVMLISLGLADRAAQDSVRQQNWDRCIDADIAEAIRLQPGVAATWPLLNTRP